MRWHRGYGLEESGLAFSISLILEAEKGGVLHVPFLSCSSLGQHYSLGHLDRRRDASLSAIDLVI